MKRACSHNPQGQASLMVVTFVRLNMFVHEGGSLYLDLQS